ncbi:MAG TPA: type II secretion system major pseudopilin GspG [Verrucomicrobiae bacterium]|nr:type II secretion system major pseudopilin GspG [Verrucomicrobiae bacterium]
MKLITQRIRSRSASAAFTLIELLLVLAILGILAAIVVPKMAGRTQDAQLRAAATQISVFKTSLSTFELDNGYYPRGQNGLQDLIQRPRDAQNWKGPYLDTDVLPKDPWGHDYVYTSPGRYNTTGYDISSNGPDGQPGTDDDITSWTKR